MNHGRYLFITFSFLLAAGIFFPYTPNESMSEDSFKQVNIKQQGFCLISVYDNYQVDKELKSAWGFATVVKTPDETLLFDTGGNSEILLFNMKKINYPAAEQRGIVKSIERPKGRGIEPSSASGGLNIDPQSIDKVIISHIHADHLGGLKGFLEENKNVTVFIPSSFPDSIRDMIKNHQAEFTDVYGPQKISKNICSTGKLSGPPKEQSIIINSKRGLIIITGCAHPGIISIIKIGKEVFPEQKIYLVVGGFHHPPVSVVEELKESGVEKIAPSHCTGDQVIEVFKKEYRDNFIEYGVGKAIEIN